MISDECSNRFVPTAATDYWQCPAGIACQRAVFSEAFCRLCYVLRSGINNQQLNWVHVNFRKLDTRICFKSFQYATHRPTGVMCHSSTGIPENSRTRPHGELGPSQNSAPWRSRPRGELGPTENSAPTTAENSAPTAENSAPTEIPTKCLFGQHGFPTLWHGITAFTSIHNIYLWAITYGSQKGCRRWFYTFL